jgi:Glycosyltransferase sugar-binding region containing DXD motif
MMRLADSFKQSGWEHRFYTHDDMVAFLKRHFPAPVLEAFHAVRHGAYKADIFRLCVLLLSGGLYADVDILLLQGALDVSIPGDVGFMVPTDTVRCILHALGNTWRRILARITRTQCLLPVLLDSLPCFSFCLPMQPGALVNKQMCVWNGIVASAPGHPFLAKALETVVNQVRNRFTLVDIDATFCPNPELSVLHAWPSLAMGPCLLGSSINRVIGRHPGTSHVAGELVGLWTGKQHALTEHGTSFVVSGGDSVESRIPGRTVFLKQDKNLTSGKHQFLMAENDAVFAATDFPDIKQEQKVNNGPEHYVQTQMKNIVWGSELVYVDQISANEDVRVVVAMPNKL